MRGILFVLGAVCAASALATYEDRLVSEAVVHPDRVARSGWLWNSEKPVTDGGESFFRLRYYLMDEPIRADLFAYFDDAGHVYSNGRQIPFQNAARKVDAVAFLKSLAKGRNVLAVSVKNGSGPGGVVFLGKVVLKSGKTVYLHSDERVNGAAAVPQGWTTPDFDDSNWAPAKFQADAMGFPWARASWATKGFLSVFLTDRENARYEADEEKSLRLPEGFRPGPEPDAKVVYEGHLPYIEAYGRRFNPDWYLCGTANKWSASGFVKYSQLGFPFIQLSTDSAHFETGVGTYDFYELDQQARRALVLNPKAMFILAPRLILQRWLEKHPDEAIVYLKGPVKPGSNEHFGRPFRPSPASKAYRAEACHALREMCEWVKRQPWGNRVVGVRPCWGIYKEWHMYGMWDGPDVGPRMAEAFRRYEGGKWAKENPPTMEERTNGSFLLDPVKNAKAIDFFKCQQFEVADLAACFARTIKENLPGRLVGMWYGYVLTAQAPEGANILLDRMLSNPDIDFLSNPATYQAASRDVGGSFMHRTIPSTYHRYGKLCVLEDDHRYHWLLGWDKPQYFVKTPRGSLATAERNYLSKLFDGCGVQLTDAIPGAGERPVAFDQETVVLGFEKARAAFERVKGLVPVDSGADTAVVVDYWERFLWDVPAEKSRGIRTGRQVYEESPIAFHKSGAVFDVMTADDYIATKKPYRIVAFLNLFRPAAKTIDGIRTKLAADGSTAIRVEPTGVPQVDLGVKTVRTQAVPVTGVAWAKLFGEAGAHMYVAPESYIRRQGDVIMYHTAEAGTHVITLPESDRGKVFFDVLSGGSFAAPRMELECDGPRTWLFAPKDRVGKK